MMTLTDTLQPEAELPGGDLSIEGQRPPERDEIGSFDEVILPHLDAAYNLARWLVRNGHDAEDVVQDAYLRAFRYFGTFHGGDARAWLLTIVRNAYFRWLRKNRTQPPVTDFDEETHRSIVEAKDPEMLLLQTADSQLIEQAMTALPVRFREVLVLRELEGLSYKEMADVLGVPLGTVMSSLSRARERFRQAVSDLMRRHAVPESGSPAMAGRAMVRE